MKKLFFKFAIISAASLALSTYAFAQTAPTAVAYGDVKLESGTQYDIGGAMFKVSTNVDIVASITAPAYAVGGKHLTGDTAFAALSTDPTIASNKDPDTYVGLTAGQAVTVAVDATTNVPSYVWQ